MLQVVFYYQNLNTKFKRIKLKKTQEYLYIACQDTNQYLTSHLESIFQNFSIFDGKITYLL